MKKTVYMIGGPMGAGKTTVSQLLKKQLDHAVFLDGDWCWDADPFVVTDETKAMVLDNICYMLNSFIACSAYSNIIFCWVMHEQSIIDYLLENINISQCKVRLISLMADKETLVKRLNKDVLQGIRKSDVINRSLSKLPLYEKLDTIKIDTTGKEPELVAKEICSL